MKIQDLEKFSQNSTRPSLTQSILEKILIKYPKDLKIQQKIVDVLDNFEKICNDLNIGLPREIELRRKQYEYYREKLLTFDGKLTHSFRYGDDMGILNG